MKLTMQLTLDGLVRAMRATAHDLAEAVEKGGAETAGEFRAAESAARGSARPRRGGEHDLRDA